MSDLSSIVVPMDKEHTDRVLSPRAALLVCVAAAILGWIGVAGAVFLGKAVIQDWRDVDIAGDTLSKVAPAAGGSSAPQAPGR
jgi:hypothetical protein